MGCNYNDDLDGADTDEDSGTPLVHAHSLSIEVAKSRCGWKGWIPEQRVSLTVCERENLWYFDGYQGHRMFALPAMSKTPANAKTKFLHAL